MKKFVIVLLVIVCISAVVLFACKNEQPDSNTDSGTNVTESASGDASSSADSPDSANSADTPATVENQAPPESDGESSLAEEDKVFEDPVAE